MDLGLKDKVVLITGASGGIGRALAESFAAEGAQLILHGGSQLAALEQWLAVQTWRQRAIAVGAEISDAASVETMFQRGLERFGRIDVAIANAGRWTPEFRLAHEASVERVKGNLATNLHGAIWTTQSFFRALAKTGPRPGEGASLILIGSTAGHFGEKGHMEYSVSKAGLYGILYSAKNEIVELDPYGRVNLLEPGWTVTHMARAALEEPGLIARVLRTMPVRQLARATDIAQSALFLASPRAARHVSGQVITVAGGMEGRIQWETAQIDEAGVRRRVHEE
ncbi:MAG: hypothetical protein RL277_115 [Planctomycetota bacterium]|jgi:3-oxoacyl-[acyl-carrier protein] reductase